MKSVLFTAVIFLVIADSKCSNKVLPGLPPCIQAKIDEIKKQPRWNPPAKVEEYHYNGKRVFLFSSDCCDNFNPLYNENCNPLCAPSGGITGRGDGSCPDFKEKAKLVRTVWKDER